MLHFGDNFEKSRLILHELGLLRRLLSRSRFSRPLRRLSDLIHLLFHKLGSVLKHLHSRIALHARFVSRCPYVTMFASIGVAFVQDEHYGGKMSSNRRYFYGVRVQLRATTDGLPLKFCILPGNCSDLQGLAELALELKDSVQFLSIRATMFTNGKIICRKLTIWNCRCRANRTRNAPVSRGWKFINRWCENTLKRRLARLRALFPKKIRATNLDGFLLKIALFLFAYPIDKAFI